MAAQGAKPRRGQRVCGAVLWTRANAIIVLVRGSSPSTLVRIAIATHAVLSAKVAVVRILRSVTDRPKSIDTLTRIALRMARLSHSVEKGCIFDMIIFIHIIEFRFTCE